jgi:hypothetical protein
MAKYLGFETIILIGQDLAFTGGQSHTKGLEGALGNNDEYIQSRELVEVEGIDGTMLQTDIQMFFYKKWFENTISNYKGEIKVIDATEGGARINGAEIMTLDNTINRECKNKLDIYKIEQEIQCPYTDNISDSLLGEFKQIPKTVCRIEEQIKEQIRKQETLLKSLGNVDKLTEKQIKKISRIMGENKKIEEDPLLELVTMYAHETEYEGAGSHRKKPAPVKRI